MGSTPGMRRRLRGEVDLVRTAVGPDPGASVHLQAAREFGQRRFKVAGLEAIDLEAWRHGVDVYQGLPIG